MAHLTTGACLPPAVQYPHTPGYTHCQFRLSLPACDVGGPIAGHVVLWGDAGGTLSRVEALTSDEGARSSMSSHSRGSE
jgi:hypothetical protein